MTRSTLAMSCVLLVACGGAHGAGPIDTDAGSSDAPVAPPPDVTPLPDVTPPPDASRSLDATAPPDAPAPPPDVTAQPDITAPPDAPAPPPDVTGVPCPGSIAGNGMPCATVGDGCGGGGGPGTCGDSYACTCADTHRWQ